ncbi:HD-GYP domain-containing protein [Rhodoferax sp.]|uniref:HD-GYP domain-containing protein n=1 Tax=Rhodoferax sp. TaxID=50421 RepID=UPI0039B9154A
MQRRDSAQAGRLTAEEFSVMKAHVQLGIDIIAKSNWLNDAGDVIEFHHERFDGRGYQHRLRGDSIPLVARLFDIVDVFDALTSRRPYKEPVPLQEAVRILAEGRGSHFNPRLLNVFQDMTVELHGELAGLAETGLPQQLQQQVTKCFLERNGYEVPSLRGALRRGNPSRCANMDRRGLRPRDDGLLAPRLTASR